MSLCADLPLTGTVLDVLNALPRGRNRPFGESVVRLDPDGRRWWLMNHPETGWSSFGYVFASLAALLAVWDVTVTGCGRDEWSFYYRVAPAGANAGTAGA